MSLEVLTSLIVSFCANYAAGNIDKALDCSDYVVNCAIKKDVNKEKTEKCLINFQKGFRYEEKILPKPNKEESRYKNESSRQMESEDRGK